MSLFRQKLGKSLNWLPNWSQVGLGVSSLALLLVFQNCGKAGGDGDSDSSSLLKPSSEMTKFQAAPFPYDVNVNQVSFMTCPKAGEKPVQLTEDLDSPFYSIRVGAYDNRVLANRFPNHFPVALLSETEKTRRLKAGVGLRAEYLNYIREKFAARISAKPDPVAELKEILRDGLANSPFPYRLANSFIYRTRSVNGFSFDASLTDVKQIMYPLKDGAMIDQMLAPPIPAQGPTEKMNYVDYAGDISYRSFVSSFAMAKNEDHRELVRSAVGFNSQVTIGFTDDDEDLTVFDLHSPTGDNNRSVYGRSYRMNLTSVWPGRADYDQNGAPGSDVRSANEFIAPYSTPASQGITEIATQGLEGTNRFEIDNTELEQQQWECFSLMVVREVDRRNREGVFLDPDRDPTLRTVFPGTTIPKKNKYFDYQAAANSAIVPGVKVACPPQEIGNANLRGSLNYTGNGGKERMQLEIARRFLPAEFFDINTNPEYMCVVPRTTVQGFGQCYQSGDFNGGQYIMYVPGVVREANRNVQCGRNTFTGEVQKECPAFVNICYRRY